MSSLREIYSFSKNRCTSCVECFRGKKVNKIKERNMYSPDTNKSLLCDHNEIIIGNLIKRYFLCKDKEDVPCHPFFARGSMTIEAALVVPLFLFACMVILSIINVIEISVDHEAKIHKLAREGAVYGYGTGKLISGREGDYINLALSYPVSLPVKIWGLKSVTVKNHCYAHIFNGYDDKAGDRVGDTREYVYITENGSVYHRRRSCSYLDLSVREVAGNTLVKKRNEDGSIYYACEECAKGVRGGDVSSHMVYITDYGERYHLRINCSRLKRTLEVVPLSGAAGKTPCQKCGY